MPTSKPPRKKHANTQHTRPRNTIVSFNISPSALNEIVLKFNDDGYIMCEGAIPGTYKTTIAYDRENKKPKVVTQVPGEQAGTFALEASTLRHQYDRILFLDTNTSMIDDVRVSVCCALISDALEANAEFIVINPLATLVLYNVNEDANPEMVALDILLSNFEQQITRASAKPLGIVTDTELGRHENLNKRVEGYLGSKLLPDHTEIIYASTDASAGVLSAALRHCDSQSDQLMKYFKKTGIDKSAPVSTHPSCEAWRLAKFTNNSNEYS